MKDDLGVGAGDQPPADSPAWPVASEEQLGAVRWGPLAHKLRGTRGSGTRRVVAAGVWTSEVQPRRAWDGEKPKTGKRVPTSAQPARGCVRCEF